MIYISENLVFLNLYCIVVARTAKECSDKLNVLILSFASTFHKPVLCSNKHPATEELAFKMMFKWDFISVEMKYFHFGGWSISYTATVFMIQPKMKLTLSVISLRSFWQKLNFISCSNFALFHIKEKICTCVYFIKTKIIDFYWIGRFSRTTTEKNFHLILPAIKSNVSRISFIVGWNFIAGLT